MDPETSVYCNSRIENVRARDYNTFHNGDIHETYNGPVTKMFGERPADIPKPGLVIPYDRDDNFVGRESELEEIEKKRQILGEDKHVRLALYGAAGTGKSQIAIEYAYRFSNKNPGAWIFWVHGSDVSRFKQGYESIAHRAQLPCSTIPGLEVLAPVSEWLSSESSGTWLLVLDNVDDSKVYFASTLEAGESKFEPIGRFLPQKRHCTILLTSRNKSAAVRVTGHLNGLVEINPMNSSEALALFKTRKGVISEEESSAENLVRILEGNPLAITQAASFIENGRADSIEEYLKMFKGSNIGRMSLLNYSDGPEIRRDPSSENSVLKTWQMSFRQIRMDSPDAADLLCLMSIFEKSDIPEVLLKSQDETSFTFKEKSATLVNYSLTTRSKSGGFTLHGLTQLAVRNWLNLREELTKWRKLGLERISDAESNEATVPVLRIQPYLEHALEVVIHEQEDYDGQKKWVKIAESLSSFYSIRGAYGSSIYYGRKAVDVRKSWPTLDLHPLLESQASLATILEECGDYHQAKSLLEDVLRRGKETLRPNDPLIISTMLCLGELHWANHEPMGEKLVREAVELAKSGYDSNPFSFDASSEMLSRILTNEERYQELLEVSREAVKLKLKRVSLYSLEHSPDVSLLESKIFIALSYANLGREGEALQICEEIVRSEKETKVQKDRILMQGLLKDVYWIYAKCGRSSDAEDLRNRLVKDIEHDFGPTSTNMSNFMRTDVLVLHLQGKLDEGEARHRELVELQKKRLGSEHLRYLRGSLALANALYSRGKSGEAKLLMQEVCDTAQRVHPNHAFARICKEALREIGGEELPEVFEKTSQNGERENVERENVEKENVERENAEREKVERENAERETTKRISSLRRLFRRFEKPRGPFRSKESM